MVVLGPVLQSTGSRGPRARGAEDEDELRAFGAGDPVVRIGTANIRSAGCSPGLSVLGDRSDRGIDAAALALARAGLGAGESVPGRSRTPPPGMRNVRKPTRTDPIVHISTPAVLMCTSSGAASGSRTLCIARS